MTTYDNIPEVLAMYNSEPQQDKNNYIIVTGGIGDFVALDYIYNYSKTKHIIVRGFKI